MNLEIPNTPSVSRFFLAFPADELALPLNRLQEQLALPGRRLLGSQFHLTLRFLGQPTPTQYNSLLRQLPTMALPAFTLQLDTLGFFSAANVLWIGPSRVPSALTELYDDLLLRCASLRIPPPHKAYRPHISLFRQTEITDPTTLPAISPIEYRPRQLCLYRSVPSAEGRDYQIEASWLLGEGETTAPSARR